MARDAQYVVLLVEADSGLRRLMDSALTAQGYDVIATWDSLDALQGARVRKDHIRLLVADHDSPRVDALGLVARFTAEHPDVRVLLVSQDRRIAPHGGTWHYLRKPFTPRQLLGKVEEILR